MVGYKRVSTYEQNPGRQLEGIKLDKEFLDYASAKNTDRPQLFLLMDYVREDDTVLVHSMDRLARNVKDLRKIVDDLVKKGVAVHFVKENLKFDGKECAMSNLLLSIMGAFAEFEYNFIRERQREGILFAKKNGTYGGRKQKLDENQITYLKEVLTTTRKSKLEIARELGISSVCLYVYIKRIFPDGKIPNREISQKFVTVNALKLENIQKKLLKEQPIDLCEGNELKIFTPLPETFVNPKWMHKNA